jgi:nitrogen fixation protein FixH
MNWGYKLAIVYLAFAAGILTLVFKAKGEKIDLVAKDYYNQELAFGQRIAASNNAAALSGGLSVNVLNDQVVVTMPADCSGQNFSGTVTLYCPSDASSDRTVSLISGAQNQVILTENLKKGLYLVQLKWKMNEKEYYLEKSLTL